MRTLILLLLSVSLACAQTPPILPNGTVVGGHLVGSLGTTSVPVLSGASCGTPVLTPGSTDFAGQFQAKGTTTCVVTFGTAFASQPFCVVSDETTAATYTYTKTAISMGTTVINDLINWICIGQIGN